MSNNHPASGETPLPLYVSSISISLANDFRNTIGSIKLRSKNNISLRDIEKNMRAGNAHLEEFNPPLPLDLDDHIFVECSSKSRKPRDVVIEINLRDIAGLREERGIRSYRKKERKIEVVVAGNYQLPSLGTTTKLTEACSQFRLLIIGNSGVGKSTLIHKVFGVAGVHVSENRRGTADIDREFISPTNDRFVVHDSLGFEAADQRNIDLVEEFVKKRRAVCQLKDQLHAVWLCLEIPYCGGRLLEAGTEKFLQRRNDILGKVPLVVVLTKVDLLNMQLELDQPPDEPLSLEDYRSKHVKEHLIEPLCNAAGEDITYVTVSTEDDYSESLSDLVMATDETMKKYQVEEATRVAAVIAQWIAIKEKIDKSIAGIRKTKYWKLLLKSATFRGDTLQECLEVIHKDITTVWNFSDEYQCSMDDDIVKLLLRTYLEDALHADESLNFGKSDIKIVMAYIVDLICVMRVMLLLPSSYRMTEETVTLVRQAYEKHRKFVHLAVDGFDAKLGPQSGGDHVVDKMEELIWLYSIPDHEVEGLRKKILKIVPSGSV